MYYDELFWEPDLDGDGFLSREDLYHAACRGSQSFRGADRKIPAIFLLRRYVSVEAALGETASCGIGIAESVEWA